MTGKKIDVDRLDLDRMKEKKQPILRGLCPMHITQEAG